MIDLRRALRPIAGLLLLLLAPPAAVAAEARSESEHSPYVFDKAKTVVAFGDLHGSLAPFIDALRGVGLVDDTLSWVGGTVHVVLNGDLLDRGPQERELLDFVMRLEAEAFAAGGRVHVLLGNHEIMNLTRDLRYVPARGFAAFADEEDNAERRAALRLWAATQRGGSKRELREAFDERFPPGYFARVRAFSTEGHYGSWLLTKPFVIKVAGLLFVHGGLTEQVAARGIDAINESAHAQLRSYLEAFEILEEEGVFLPTTDFAEGFGRASALLSPAHNDPRRRRRSLRNAASTLLRSPETLPFSASGPLWYRGNSLESERLERDRIEQVLELLGARAILVGHTPTRSSMISSRFERRLFRLDVGTTYGNQIQALVLNPQGEKVFLPRQRRYRDVPSEGPRGEIWARGHEELPDGQIEEFLEDAEVRDRRLLGRGSTRPELVQLEQGEVRMRGIFKSVDVERSSEPGCPAEPADRFAHEVAAYRLDRLIGLGMVPVTALREIDDVEGSLQLWIEEAVDQRAIDAYGLRARDPQAIELQTRKVRVFDALIGNDRRRPSDLLYDLESSELLIVDHSKAFCPEADAIAILGEGPCQLDPALRESLIDLDAPALRDALRGLLSREEREAILTRRDRILEACPSLPAGG